MERHLIVDQIGVNCSETIIVHRFCVRNTEPWVELRRDWKREERRLKNYIDQLVSNRIRDVVGGFTSSIVR